MADVIAVVARLVTGIFEVLNAAHPIFRWLVYVTFLGWGFAFPLFAIVRRVVFSVVLQSNDIDEPGN